MTEIITTLATKIGPARVLTTVISVITLQFTAGCACNHTTLEIPNETKETIKETITPRLEKRQQATLWSQTLARRTPPLMTCFHPMEAARLPGEKPLVYKHGQRPKPLAAGWEELSLPCGQCTGCRIDQTKQWAVRAVHESLMHEQNSFLTLTYSPENEPQDGSLVPAHHTLFIKKLRESFAVKKLNPETGRQKKYYAKYIRYYMCGEYGEQLSRPHFHYLIFGHNFDHDRYPWTTHNGHQYYRSPSLEKLWPYGYSTIGDVNWETAAYTARYVLKKLTGPRAEDHYERNDELYNQEVRLEPEFARMSLKPGIGAEWFAKYGYSDIYDSGDFVVIKGKKYKTPRYYDKLLGEPDEVHVYDLKQGRKLKAARNAADSTPARLDVRERYLELTLQKLPRGYENGTT